MPFPNRNASIPMATQGAADSVQPVHGGLCADTTTAAAEMDLRLWVGRYVRIHAIGADCYYLWAKDTGQTIDETARKSIPVEPPDVTQLSIPKLLPAGAEVHELVSERTVFLRFKAVANGTLRVSRS